MLNRVRRFCAHWCIALMLVGVPTLANADPGKPAGEIPLHQLPLNAALYCNASCKVDSCSHVCPAENMCRWRCDRRGRAHCGCRLNAAPSSKD